MEAGKLRHRICIEQATETTATSGETSQTWSNFARCWASISPAGSGESWRAQQVNPLLSHDIVIRFLPGVTPKMRVRFDDPKQNSTRYFGIESMVPFEERPDEIHLMCIEDVDG